MSIASTAGSHPHRLTAVDASFLTNETSSSHMHIGGILIFEGPPPPYVDLVEHVRGRLDQVPRFRQRLVVPPPGAGRSSGRAPPPLCVDLVEHVRGRLDQVPRFRQRLVVPPLEAGRPLWAD